MYVAEGGFFFCFFANTFHALFNILQNCTSDAFPNTSVVWLSPRPGTVLTVQALSEDDHKFWMQAMGGKEPVSQLSQCHHLPLTHGVLIHSL